MSGNGFEVTMPLCKAWMDEAGEMWFEGVASSTSVDRQRERMSPKAMEKMGSYRGLDLLPSHEAGALQELGTVEECWVDNTEFRVRGRLERSNPDAWRLYERLLAGKPYGLSVGGRVLAAHWEQDAATGQRVRVIDDVALDHIAVCRLSEAVNQDTYLGVLAKAAEGVAGGSEGVPNATRGDHTTEVRAAVPGEDRGAKSFPPPSSGSIVSVAADGEKSTADRGAARGGRGCERLAKLRRFMVELAKSLWPHGYGDEMEEAEEACTDRSLAAELDEMRGQMEAMAAGLQAVLAKMERVGGPGLSVVEATGSDVPSEAPGMGRRSLEGQETPGKRPCNLWKGVL